MCTACLDGMPCCWVTAALPESVMGMLKHRATSSDSPALSCLPLPPLPCPLPLQPMYMAPEQFNGSRVDEKVRGRPASPRLLPQPAHSACPLPLGHASFWVPLLAGRVPLNCCLPAHPNHPALPACPLHCTGGRVCAGHHPERVLHAAPALEGLHPLLPNHPQGGCRSHSQLADCHGKHFRCGRLRWWPVLAHMLRACCPHHLAQHLLSSTPCSAACHCLFPCPRRWPSTGSAPGWTPTAPSPCAASSQSAGTRTHTCGPAAQR